MKLCILLEQEFQRKVEPKWKKRTNLEEQTTSKNIENVEIYTSIEGNYSPISRTKLILAIAMLTVVCVPGWCKFTRKRTTTFSFLPLEVAPLIFQWPFERKVCSSAERTNTKIPIGFPFSDMLCLAPGGGTKDILQGQNRAFKFWKPRTCQALNSWKVTWQPFSIWLTTIYVLAKNGGHAKCCQFCRPLATLSAKNGASKPQDIFSNGRLPKKDFTLRSKAKNGQLDYEHDQFH